MNRKRKEEVRTVYGSIQKITSDLKELCQDEQMSYDNIPENLQETQRALDSEEAIDNLDSAIDALEEALEYLDEIV